MKQKTKNSKKQKRIIFITSAFAISLIALILIVINFRNNIVFFYSPSELKSIKLKENQIIRVGGLVKNGSIIQDEKSGLTFTVTDLENDLIVNFKGIKPDLFREGQGMVAKGKIDKISGIFLADELLTKHDEKYMPPEVKKSLKNKTLNSY